MKKPNKALVKQMQEQLEKLKAEEERRKQEEEEKQRALEEAENRRLEKVSCLLLLNQLIYCLSFPVMIFFLCAKYTLITLS